MRKTLIAIIFTVTPLLLVVGINLAVGLDAHPIQAAATADAETGESPIKAPQAVFQVTHYEFPTVAEGTEIKYDFVVENRGEAPLLIEMVQPDCSCSVASHPGQIKVGDKDKISVVVHTNEKGGRNISKSFKVTTNDPKAKLTELVVSGKIEALIDVSPSRVTITGYAGDDLSKQVLITPQNGHLFTIKEVKVNRAVADLGLELRPLGKEPSEKGYLLTVSCKKQSKGRLHDLIMMKTDLKDKPNLRIPVSCTVFAKPTKDGQKPAE